MIHYLGPDYVSGVPATDLSPADWDALPAELQDRARHLYQFPVPIVNTPPVAVDNPPPVVAPQSEPPATGEAIPAPEAPHGNATS